MGTAAEVKVKVKQEVDGKSADSKKAMSLAAKPQMADFVWKMSKLGSSMLGLGVLGAIVKLAMSSQAISALLDGFFSIIGAFMDMLMIQFMPLIGEFLKGAAGLLKQFGPSIKKGDEGARKDFTEGIGQLVKGFVDVFLPAFLDVIMSLMSVLVPIILDIMVKVIFILIKAMGKWFIVLATILGAIYGVQIAQVIATNLVATTVAVGTAAISFGASMAILGAGLVVGGLIGGAVGAGMQAYASNQIGGGANG